VWILNLSAETVAVDRIHDLGTIVRYKSKGHVN